MILNINVEDCLVKQIACCIIISSKKSTFYFLPLSKRRAVHHPLVISTYMFRCKSLNAIGCNCLYYVFLQDHNGATLLEGQSLTYIRWTEHIREKLNTVLKTIGA